jgi:ABC-type glycerol-3-phosphate transport system permease component
LNASIPASMRSVTPRFSAPISSASLPQHVTGRNYVDALSGGGLVQYLLNSIVAAGGATLIALLLDRRSGLFRL